MNENTLVVEDGDSKGSEEEDRKPAAQDTDGDEEQPSTGGEETEEPSSGGANSTKKRRRDESVESLTREAAATVSAGISLQEKWDEMFNRLKRYKEIHGNCLVPNRYKQDPSLGSWVATQRRTYKILTSGGCTSSGMNVERAKRLMELGFEWSTTDPRHVPWEERYQELKAFVAANGHAEVPMRWEENVQLSNWVSKQRQDYKLVQLGKTTRLTDRRKKLLDEVGFVWEIPRKGRRLRANKPIHNPNSASTNVSTSGGSEQGEPCEVPSFGNTATNSTMPPQLTAGAPPFASLQPPGLGPLGATAPTNTTTTPPALAEALTSMLNTVLQPGGSVAPLRPPGVNQAPASPMGAQPQPSVSQAPPPAGSQPPPDAAAMFLNILLGGMQMALNQQQRQSLSAQGQIPGQDQSQAGSVPPSAGFPASQMNRQQLGSLSNPGGGVGQGLPLLDLSSLLSGALNAGGGSQASLPWLGQGGPNPNHQPVHQNPVASQMQTNLQNLQPTLILLPIPLASAIGQQLMQQQHQQQHSTPLGQFALQPAIQQQIYQQFQQQIAPQPLVLGGPGGGADIRSFLSTLGISPESLTTTTPTQQHQPAAIQLQPFLSQQFPFMQASQRQQLIGQEPSEQQQQQQQLSSTAEQLQNAGGANAPERKEDPPDHAAV